MVKEIKGEKTAAVYGVTMMIVILTFFGVILYLIYTLIDNASRGNFTDNSIIQALITFATTVVAGTLINKNLERRNTKDAERNKIRNDISLKLIDLSGIALSKHRTEKEKEIAIEMIGNENIKVKLFFNDEVVLAVNSFLEKPNSQSYNLMTDILKKYI